MSTLGEKDVGDIVKLKENGALVDYLIVHQGLPSSMYDESCDGTWLLRKDIRAKRAWTTNNLNDYENSNINAWLNSEYLAMLDSDIQTAVKEVKIPYIHGTGASYTVNNGANGLSCKSFLLAGYEIGFTTDVSAYYPVDGALLSYFGEGIGTSDNRKRIAYLNGSATTWWLRSPELGSTYLAFYVRTNGDSGSNRTVNTYGARPTLIFPPYLTVSDDGEVSASTGPNLPYIVKLGVNNETIHGGATTRIMRLGQGDNIAKSSNKIYIVKV